MKGVLGDDVRPDGVAPLLCFLVPLRNVLKGDETEEPLKGRNEGIP